MDFLTDYYTALDEDSLQISAAQGSAFAKQVADDFNPIHHADSRRFCVPGDLLFSIAIARYGIREHMEFQFLDLLAADMPVIYPDNMEGADLDLTIVNANGKATLGVHGRGAASKRESQAESLVRNYVAFSGQNFPHILVPLMREQRVMFNPQRPLVIYQSMQLSLHHLEFDVVDVTLGETRLEINGKRGEATLNFLLSNGDEELGHGHKILIVSGLRDYDEEAIQAIQDEYAESKKRYQS